MGIVKTATKWAVGAAVIWFIKEKIFNRNLPVRIKSSKPSEGMTNPSSAMKETNSSA